MRRRVPSYRPASKYGGGAVSRIFGVVSLLFAVSACGLSTQATVDCPPPLLTADCDTAADIALDSLDAETQVAVSAVRVERSTVTQCMEGRPMYDVTFEGDGFEAMAVTIALAPGGELVACQF
jgi:hypothetical protein